MFIGMHQWVLNTKAPIPKSLNHGRRDLSSFEGRCYGSVIGHKTKKPCKGDVMVALGETQGIMTNNVKKRRPQNPISATHTFGVES